MSRAHDLAGAPVARARLGAAGAAAVATACFGLRAISLARPCWSDDEAIYAVVARELLAGRVLYRDVVDHKPPLIYALYAVTQALGGPVGGMALLHGVTILVVLGTALLLGRIAGRFAAQESNGRAPFFAALLYAVFTTTLLPFDSLAANCELYMMLPLAASVLLFLRGAAHPRFTWFAGAGALLGIAVLFKYQAGVQVLLYGGYLVGLRRSRRGRPLFGIAGVAAGLALVLASGAIVLQRAGSLGAAWFWFRFNFSYMKEGLHPFEAAVRACVRVSFVGVSALFLWALGFGAALRIAISRELRGRRGDGLHGFERSAGSDGFDGFDGFASGWLAASAVATVAGGRFFGHYFHQLTAPLAILAAPEAARLWKSRRGLVVAGMAVPAVCFALVALFHDRVMAAAGEPDPDYPRLARVIDAYSRPGDGVVVWGNLPVLAFEARRPLGSRFVFSNYLTGLSPATQSQWDPKADASANIVPESWDMFTRDLALRRPRLFVDTSPGNLAGYGKFPPSRFPRLRAILARDYHPIGEMAGIRVFERLDKSD